MKQTSFHVVLCVILIFATSPASCNSETLEYLACAANLSSCGSIQNVGYPFWGGNRPQFCGLQQFQLTCPDTAAEHPSIEIGMSKLEKVLNISTSPPRMVVAHGGFLRPVPHCHDTRTYSMLTLTKFFKLTSNFHNISIFYSCPSSVLQSNLTKTYNCSYSNGTGGYVFYFMNGSGSADSGIKSCTLGFTLPVFKRDCDELNNGNATLLSVLRKGFELDYEVNMTPCLACQNSGGHCGSWNTSLSEFACHCREGSHPLLCPRSGNTILFA